MKCLVVVLFCISLGAKAQNKPLLVEGVTPSLYISHTVGPKENYYSVGRIYNISPKEIAPFNNLELEKGLSLNQVIKIPLSVTNFLQDVEANADEVLVPVYHTVKDKEGLYRVSVNYNKLPVEKIVKWNNLKAPEVSNGTKLIIGYLRVKKDLSPLAGAAKPKPADITTTPLPVNTVPEKQVVKPVATVKPLPLPVEKEKVAVAEPVKKTPEVAVVKEPVKTIATPVNRKTFNGGFFKPLFDQQSNSKEVAAETGAAAIFKSTSGWEDGKYYCLHNAASPGTIIKITNSVTGKNVYAKVLDAMPDMEKNNGLLIRLSNAAADELGAASDGKFYCTLNYTK